jgi:RNA polymerase sigma-70 factor (ECF subfamily)
MWDVVAGLPDRQRQAVVLRHVGQLREEEIAQAMGISRGTVSSTLRAAYKSLRIAIADPAPVGESR